jgi:hypothetical protein
MFTLDTRDIERMARKVGEAEKQMPFLCSFALNNAMKDVRDAEYAQMKASFDRPTPYSLNSLRIEPSTKNNLRARLHFKEFGGTPAFKYLGPEVEGGKRRHTGFERALQRAGILRGDEYVVPSRRLNRNAYGNMPGGLATSILSGLGAATDPMQNRAAKSRRKTKKPRAQYVVFRNRGKAPDGIYQQKAKWAVPVFLFVSAPNYRARYPYYDSAKRVFPASFKKHFHAGFERFVAKALK